VQDTQVDMAASATLILAEVLAPGLWGYRLGCQALAAGRE
jgi:hypothetical protein